MCVIIWLGRRGQAGSPYLLSCPPKVCVKLPIVQYRRSREKANSQLIRIGLGPQLFEGKDIGKVFFLFSRSYVLNYDGYWSEVAYIIEWQLPIDRSHLYAH